MQRSPFLLFLTVLCSNLLPWAHCLLLSPRNAVTLAAIKELNSLYSFSLDEKNFDTLADVYTVDAVLDGGAATTIGGEGNTINGREAIVNFWRKIFSNETVVTDHTVTTLYAYNFTRNTASSKHYADPFYFNNPSQLQGGFLFRNESIVTRERFVNQYVQGKDEEWRISQQKGPQVIVCWILPWQIYFFADTVDSAVFGRRP